MFATPSGEKFGTYFPFDPGGYPPVMKVYELSELSMKFERRIDADIIQFQVRSS